VEGHGLPPQPNPSPEEIAGRVKARAAAAKRARKAG
jgi:hypothetical protein